MQKLTVEPLRQASFVQGHDNAAFGIAGGRHGDISRAFAIARRRQIDIAFADRGAAFLRLPDQLENRAAERHQLVEPLARQQSGTHLEELFRRRIDREDMQIQPDQQHRHRQNGKYLTGRRGRYNPRTTHGVHLLAHILGIGKLDYIVCTALHKSPLRLCLNPALTGFFPCR